MTHLNLKSIRRERVCLIACLVTLACVTLSPSARGYHFFYVKPPVPAKWASLPVSFAVDNGPTNILAEIQTAFSAWNNITTAKNVLGTPTLAAGDFNAANLGTAWGNTGDGKQEVVLDEDGAVLSHFGLNPAGINGYGPTVKDSAAGTIIDAFLIINGKRTDFDRQSTEVHELGHIQGLAHSSVGMHNSASFASDALDPISITAVPTMHPYSYNTGTSRRTPEADDIAGLSELYPEASFTTSFGSIQGTVTRCAGDKGVTGANVRAINTANSNIQLSRFTGFDGNGEGRFVINGVPPGTYRLVVEPMGANGFIIATNFGAPPFASENDFPTEYYNPPDEDSCIEELPDKAVNVTVTAGGSATSKNFKVGGIDLAFVVDDTGSMSAEIGGVRTALTQFVNVMDGINRLTGIRFPNTAVITFKDDVTKRVVSNDPTRLKSVIGALVASGGGDCPEASNAAVLTAGRLLKKGGVAVLFTDADSRSDGPDRNTVTELYRSKSLSLATLLSGTCTGTLAAPPELSQPLIQIDQTVPPGGADFDELPPPPTLGVESSVRTFSEESILTGGIFTSIPGIKSGNATETQRYVNTGTNLAVSSVVPAVGLVSPGDGPQNGTFNVEILGSNTNFQSASNVSFSGGGIAVNSRTINSPEKITANITVQPGATLGFRDVTVTTDLGSGIENATGFGAFNVVSPPTSPGIIGVVPSQGGQGETLNVSISGAATHFVNGASVANFGSGITINSTTVLSSTSALANITISPSAAIGLRDVVVKTGSETAAESIVGPFLVAAPAPPIPLITLVNPVQGKQDQTLNLTITGKNTNFVNGTSVVSFSGTGIVVNSTSVSSPTNATANITIAPNSALGFRDVFVTTGGEVASNLSGFQVSCNPLTSPQLLQFNAAAVSTTEDGSRVVLTVTRSACEASGTLIVNFATVDGAGLTNCNVINGVASPRCDYENTAGTLTFAAGETSKSFSVAVVDDGYAEGAETFSVALTNPSGASLGLPSVTTVTINDNDGSNGPNPIDSTNFFVRQQYLDFLGREPDPPGLAGWTSTINNCSGDTTQCDRIHVSQLFFQSAEFQDRGYFVYRFYPVAFGRKPDYGEFVPDLASVSGFLDANQLEAAKVAFIAGFMARPAFVSAYNGLTNQQYVDALLSTAGVTLASRQTMINALNASTLTRAQVLRQIVESTEVSTKYNHQAYAVMEYFGYLRRQPDGFYLQWIQVLDATNDPRGMVTGFVTSQEYRNRFGP